MASYFYRDITAWMDATEPLSANEYRVYDVLLNLMYILEGPITRHERGFAVRCNMHILTLRATLEKLIERGKIEVTPDGKLTNKRMMIEIAKLPMHPSRRKPKPRPDLDPTSTRPPTDLGATSDQPPRGLAHKPLKTKGLEPYTIQDKTKHTIEARVRAFGPDDFIGDDDITMFSKEEIAAIAEDLNSLTNIKGQIRQAYRFMRDQGVEPSRRKSAMQAYLSKRNDEAAERRRVNDAKQSESQERESPRIHPKHMLP